MLDEVQLLLGIARTRRNHGAPDRAGGPVHDESARRQVIRERVEHAIAAAEACREQAARRVPRIVLPSFGLVDRAGRREQPSDPLGLPGNEPAERRLGLLQRRQCSLAHDRQARERRAGVDLRRVDVAEMPLPSRSLQHPGQQPGQVAHQVEFALPRIPRLAVVEMLCHGRRSGRGYFAALSMSCRRRSASCAAASSLAFTGSIVVCRVGSGVGALAAIRARAGRQRERCAEQQPGQPAHRRAWPVRPASACAACRTWRRGSSCDPPSTPRGRTPSRPRFRAARPPRRPSRRGRSPGCIRSGRT